MARSHKPVLLFVFAHPDDDAFGPSGSLIKLSRQFDIYFLCATRGESGQGHAVGQGLDLATVREGEVRESAKVIGARGVYFLGFRDGDLSNNLYHALAERIQGYIDRLQPEVLLTWEPRGVSGHIDHIVVSMVCHYLFERCEGIRQLMLYCLSQYQTDQFLEGYFIYRPPGYRPEEIDLIFDTSDVWDRKMRAMQCHRSQVADMHKILERPRVRLMEDCYIVKNKV